MLDLSGGGNGEEEEEEEDRGSLRRIPSNGPDGTTGGEVQRSGRDRAST